MAQKSTITKRFIVEIEIPVGSVDAWDKDTTGTSTFTDCIMRFLRYGAAKFLKYGMENNLNMVDMDTKLKVVDSFRIVRVDESPKTEFDQGFWNE